MKRNITLAVAAAFVLLISTKTWAVDGGEVDPNCSAVQWFCEDSLTWKAPWQACWGGQVFCPGETIWDGTAWGLNKISFDCVGTVNECEPCPVGDLGIDDVTPAVVPAGHGGGALTVTILASDSCNCDPGGAGTTQKSFTVTVQVMEDCGGCMPDNTEWTCNAYDAHNDPVVAGAVAGYTDQGGGHYTNGGAQIFYNRHYFDMTLNGKAQGTGRIASEIFAGGLPNREYILNGGVLVFDTGVRQLVPPTPTMPNGCSNTCTGPNRVGVTDRYSRGNADPGAAWFAGAYVPANGNVFTWFDDTQWLNQQVFVDGVMLGSGFSGHVVLSHDITLDTTLGTITYSNYNCAKAGNI